MNLVELYRLRLADGIEAGDISPMMVFPIGQWHSAKYPELPHNIRTTKAISDDDQKRLGEAVKAFKAQFKAAGSSGAVFACILGPEEVASGQVTLKDLRTAEQKSVRRAELTDFLKTWLR